MKLHIFDSTGDTVVDCCTELERAEAIIEEAWGQGDQVFTGEGERVKDAAHFRDVAQHAEDAYVVPQLRGG